MGGESSSGSRVCAHSSVTALAQPKSHVCARAPPALKLPGKPASSQAPLVAGEGRKEKKNMVRWECGPAGPSTAPGSSASTILLPRLWPASPTRAPLWRPEPAR